MSETRQSGLVFNKKGSNTRHNHMEMPDGHIILMHRAVLDRLFYVQRQLATGGKA